MIPPIPRPIEAAAVAPFGTGLSDRNDQGHRLRPAPGAGGNGLVLTAEGRPTHGIDRRLAVPLLVQDPAPYESTLHGA